MLTLALTEEATITIPTTTRAIVTTIMRLTATTTFPLDPTLIQSQIIYFKEYIQRKY